MATKKVKELTYGTEKEPIAVECAKRDIAGNIITEQYATKSNLEETESKCIKTTDPVAYTDKENTFISNNTFKEYAEFLKSPQILYGGTSSSLGYDFYVGAHGQAVTSYRAEYIYHSGHAFQFPEASGTLALTGNITEAVANKQNILVSGTNIKTINNTTILGSGNIDLSKSYVDFASNQTITGIKTFSEHILTDMICAEDESALVRKYYRTGTKDYCDVFGSVKYNTVLMGNVKRPFYTNVGSDFTGTELVLSSDLENYGSLLFEGNTNGVDTSVFYENINQYEYKAFIIQGYHENVESPNVCNFILLLSQLGTDADVSNFNVMLSGNNWSYYLRMTLSDEKVYFYSTTDYSGSTVFYVTKVIGVC